MIEQMAQALIEQERSRVFIALQDIEICEGYLCHMAKEGYHLKRMKGNYLYFEKKQDLDMVYRVDKRVYATMEQIVEQHKKNGWEYVCKMDDWSYVFRKEKEVGRQELFSSPPDQAKALKELEKNEIIASFIVSLILLGNFIYFAYQSIQWIQNSAPFILLLMGVVLLLVSLWNLLFPFIAKVLLQLRLRKERRSLLSGRFMSHEGPWRKWQKAELLAKRFSVAFSILLLIDCIAVFWYVLPQFFYL